MKQVVFLPTAAQLYMDPNYFLLQVANSILDIPLTEHLCQDRSSQCSVVAAACRSRPNFLTMYSKCKFTCNWCAI
uniref:ShKT domain-containing protein n=1 Tax=Steinernema glaseri TaxID=37863 RepID=A0A1I7ZT63_9BILA